MKVITNTTYQTKQGKTPPNEEIEVSESEGKRLLAIGAARLPEKRAAALQTSTNPGGGQGNDPGKAGEPGKGGEGKK